MKSSYSILLSFLFLFVSTCYSQTSRENIDSGFSKYNNDFRGAIIEYTKAIKKDINNEEAYLLRATAKSGLNDHTGAIADYNRFIEIQPNFPDAYVGRGIIKINSKTLGEPSLIVIKQLLLTQNVRPLIDLEDFLKVVSMIVGEQLLILHLQ